MKRSTPLQRTPLRRSTGESRLTVTAPRKVKCKACKEPYLRLRPLQVACSPDCARALVRVNNEKQDKAKDKAKREAMKTRGDWTKEAQAAFNSWVRARDAGLPCICCGRMSAGASLGGDFDAGHFRSRGAAPHLRFDERNVHAQLKHCNRYAFDVSAYRAGLIERIGLQAVEALEADQEPRRLSIDDLKAIKAKYGALARELKKAAR